MGAAIFRLAAQPTDEPMLGSTVDEGPFNQGELPPLAEKPRRAKFFVWDGETGRGKTERALQIWGSEHTLLLNCHDVTTPNMRGVMTGMYSASVVRRGGLEADRFQQKAFPSKRCASSAGAIQLQSRCL